MKNRFNMSEEEKNSILSLHENAKNLHGTTLNETYNGVGFMSGEPNGLKIKKEESNESSTKEESNESSTMDKTAMIVKKLKSIKSKCPDEKLKKSIQSVIDMM